MRLIVAVVVLSGATACTDGRLDGVGATTTAPTTTSVGPPDATVPLDAPAATDGDPDGPTTTATTLPPVGPIDDIPPVPDAAASALVDRLAVAEPSSPAPYRRDAFGSGWDYDGATGCNTRELVLAQESGPGLVVDDRCKPLTGSWVSLYDGLATADPADLEIDHLVPLAEAWRTGAAWWTDDRRRAFANDLDDPATLVAVSSHSNRSKQDSTPAGWLPTDPEGRCSFVADWVRVKYRWGLTVAPDEKVAIVQVLDGCR